MVGNLLIIVTITVSKTLNWAMYFFLACLSFIDLMYSSAITLRLISDLFLGKNTISFESCMTQLFTEHFFGGLRYLFCWSWPMTVMWPSASLALFGDHEAEGVYCAAGVLGWRFSALNNST